MPNALLLTNCWRKELQDSFGVGPVCALKVLATCHRGTHRSCGLILGNWNKGSSASRRWIATAKQGASGTLQPGEAKTTEQRGGRSGFNFPWYHAAVQGRATNWEKAMAWHIITSGSRPTEEAGGDPRATAAFSRNNSELVRTIPSIFHFPSYCTSPPRAEHRDTVNPSKRMFATQVLTTWFVLRAYLTESLNLGQKSFHFGTPSPT